jgi:hypothetical protein
MAMAAATRSALRVPPSLLPAKMRQVAAKPAKTTPRMEIWLGRTPALCSQRAVRIAQEASREGIGRRVTGSETRMLLTVTCWDAGYQLMSLR